ncbi:hypothetical protein JOM56_013914 [Amanita muscaria]
MAIHPSSVLTSSSPAAVAPASVHITHIQLRDLVLCPREPGIVSYVHEKGIIEHDIYSPHLPPRLVATPDFRPNTLAALCIPDTNDILYAAGGQDADLHFSYHSIYRSSSSESSTSSPLSHTSRRRRSRPPSSSKQLWSFSKHLDGCSINNSVVLSLNLSRSNESAVEPRAIVSNNDNSIKFFDVPLRTTGSKHLKDLRQVGLLRLNVPINHTSLSPDGRTVLSVGDSSEVFLHHISGSSRLTSTPIATLTLPKPQGLPFWLPQNALAASFSTAFSADGAKFAVASQEGIVAVWDVRSTKPMKVFQTDNSAGLGPAAGGGRFGVGGAGGDGLWAGGAAAIGWTNSSASGWLFEDAHLHGSTASTVRAPGWSVRNVRFGGGVGGSGKEVMVFTEHSNQLHVVDAKTFETEEIVRVPSARGRPSLVPLPMTRVRSSNTNTNRPRTSSESSLLSGTRSSRSPGVIDYVYSQLPGFTRRSTTNANATGGGRHPHPTPLAGHTRLERARDLLSRRSRLDHNRDGRRDDDNNEGNNGDDRDRSHRTRAGYSPPSSIGDSTFRALRTAGDDDDSGGGGAVGRRSRSAAAADMLTSLNRILRPGGDRGERSLDGIDEEAALLLIPELVEGVEDILNRHSIFGGGEGHHRRGSRRRQDGHEDEDEDRDRDNNDLDEEDRNTGSAVADFDYPYEFGDSSVWREATRARAQERERIATRPRRALGGAAVESEAEEEDMDIDDQGEGGTFNRGGGRGYNWITGREEDDVDERDEKDDDDRERFDREREQDDSGELDLAGVCFDPSGGHVYVASTKSIVEWNVRGADKRWWSSDGWM